MSLRPQTTTLACVLAQRVPGRDQCFFAVALLLACSMVSPVKVHAAELSINACDSTAEWTIANGAGLSATTRPGAGGALVVTMPATVGGSPGGGGPVPTITRDNVNQDPFYPAASAQTYEGVRFWVKGDGSTNWGNVDLRYGANWTEGFALFPVTTAWTEVTIPWREFIQKNFDGPMNLHYKEVFRITFGSGNRQLDGHPLSGLPAHSYQIDDIRFVDAVTLATTPKPTGTGIQNTIAKLVAKQPVKIVVMGASISWGLKTADPAADSWPTQLQARLRARYAYNQITVINGAIPGFNTFEGACALGWITYDRQPVDLLMVGDWIYNDYVDAQFVTNGAAEVARNYEYIFGMVRRHGGIELMNIQSGLNCEPGNFDLMDAPNTAIADVCTAMNIFSANVYGEFKAMGQPWLTANYYTFAGDYAHYNITGHAKAAQIVFDAIVAAESSTGTSTSGSSTTGASTSGSSTTGTSTSGSSTTGTSTSGTGTTTASTPGSTTSATTPADTGGAASTSCGLGSGIGALLAMASLACASRRRRRETA
ncbi:MAG: hypothetical protein H0W83_05255 [Planctomycetes bacterium]|nr:hypothetical protein [Planctomycetota bacterium]